jgi:hypothetical protein
MAKPTFKQPYLKQQRRPEALRYDGYWPNDVVAVSHRNELVKSGMIEPLITRAGYFAHPLLKTGDKLEVPSPEHYMTCKSNLVEIQIYRSIIVDWVADF